MQYYSAMMIKKQHNELIYKSSAMIFFLLLFFQVFQIFFGVSTNGRKKNSKKSNTGKCKQFDPYTSLSKKNYKKFPPFIFSNFSFSEKKSC